MSRRLSLLFLSAFIISLASLPVIVLAQNQNPWAQVCSGPVGYPGFEPFLIKGPEFYGTAGCSMTIAPGYGADGDGENTYFYTPSEFYATPATLLKISFWYRPSANLAPEGPDDQDWWWWWRWYLGYDPPIEQPPDIPLPFDYAVQFAGPNLPETYVTGQDDYDCHYVLQSQTCNANGWKKVTIDLGSSYAPDGLTSVRLFFPVHNWLQYDWYVDQIYIINQTPPPPTPTLTPTPTPGSCRPVQTGEVIYPVAVLQEGTHRLYGNANPSDGTFLNSTNILGLPDLSSAVITDYHAIIPDNGGEACLFLSLSHQISGTYAFRLDGVSPTEGDVNAWTMRNYLSNDNEFAVNPDLTFSGAYSDVVGYGGSGYGNRSLSTTFTSTQQVRFDRVAVCFQNRYYWSSRSVSLESLSIYPLEYICPADEPPPPTPTPTPTLTPTPWSDPCGVNAGLLARWSLDEGTGQTRFDSVGDAPLTDSGGVAQGQSTTGWYADFTISAYDFLYNQAFDIPTGPFSVAGWVKFNNLPTTGSDGFLVEEDSFALRVNRSGEVQFSVGNETPLSSLADSADWVHVAAVFDPANSQKMLCLNGRCSTQATTLSAVPQSSASLVFGAAGDYGVISDNFSGYLDEWRVYNRTLSETEINDLQQCNAALATPTPTPFTPPTIAPSPTATPIPPAPPPGGGWGWLDLLAFLLGKLFEFLMFLLTPLLDILYFLAWLIAKIVQLIGLLLWALWWAFRFVLGVITGMLNGINTAAPVDPLELGDYGAGYTFIRTLLGSTPFAVIIYLINALLWFTFIRWTIAQFSNLT